MYTCKIFWEPKEIQNLELLDPLPIFKIPFVKVAIILVRYEGKININKIQDNQSHNLGLVDMIVLAFGLPA